MAYMTDSRRSLTFETNSETASPVAARAAVSLCSSAAESWSRKSLRTVQA